MIDIKLTILYDYYKELLTKKQQTYFEDYYFNNLSLSEIADNFNITRNAIHRTIKETENKLLEYETKLELYKKGKKIESLIDSKTLDKIKEYI